jgi:hypothetical protein
MKKLKIDISFVYYIVTIIFVLIVLYFLKSNKEGMDNPEKYHIVVAKYQKDVSFLDETGIPYTVITKEEVPNKGHEATSYLYYIINNYDNLPQNVIFIHDENESWHHTGKITENIQTWIKNYEKNGSTYYEFNFNSTVPEIHPKGIAMDLYSKNDAYKNYYDKCLRKDLGDPSEISTEKGLCCAQFIVSRDVILVRDKQFYQNIYDWLVENTNGEGNGDPNDIYSGYNTSRYLEWGWAAIFNGEKK